MSFKKVFGDIDYVQDLTKEDRVWLKKFLTGTQNATKKWLIQLDEDKGTLLYKKSIRDREARRRDIYSQGSRIENELFSQGNYEKLPSSFEGEMAVNTFEDALIEAIDNERRGLPNSFRSYGNNDAIAVGNDVVICVEGHALQNRLGKVIAKRRGQYLVQVQTTKGDVSVYLSAHELARVNQMRSAM